jgi:peptidoglycan/LPS O-acetylase OafA/YrhL
MGIAAILMLAALGWPIIEKPIVRRFPLAGWARRRQPHPPVQSRRR